MEFASRPCQMDSAAISMSREDGERERERNGGVGGGRVGTAGQIGRKESKEV